jgi:phospholipase C
LIQPTVARTTKAGAIALALLQAISGALPLAAQESPDNFAHKFRPNTPIRHVIVIIGENRSFDHVYATYQPKNGEKVSNLLSKGIVNADGKPGPNYFLSAQYAAVDNSGDYSISPQGKSIYSTLPPAMTDGAPTAASDTSPAPFATAAVANSAEPDLADSYKQFLLTGATGLPNNSVDTRLPNATTLREGPYQFTTSVAYDTYSASPVHRFFQMWQQMDCNSLYSTEDNPSGCLNDLFPWVETTVGAGSNGLPQPPNFTEQTTGEGSTAMQFYNVQHGDAPYMKRLADTYTMSDNFHQSVMGGTGANHIMFGFGDSIWYSDGSGKALKPPTNQIENPQPQKGTDNYYDQDGYSGGSYVNCADLSQPGVPAVRNYLESLARPVAHNCEAGHYYLVNNYNPGYNGDGTLASQYSQFTIPPTSVRSIGDVMMNRHLPFKYYGEDWDLYVNDPTGANTYDRYCNICNPFQYSTSIMANPKTRAAHIADTNQLFKDIAHDTLPAVSIVKPSGFTDGHPASSKLNLFEGFVKKIVDEAKDNPKVWEDTAIFVTFDEGGGYYDSGYVQPVDFFGDGTRIPLIAISRFSEGGKIVHNYSDHVSIIKFIEKNWNLGVITDRSRDNLPNPKMASGNPYVPTNSPALDDLSEMFCFRGDHK